MLSTLIDLQRRMALRLIAAKEYIDNERSQEFWKALAEVSAQNKAWSLSYGATLYSEDPNYSENSSDLVIALSKNTAKVLAHYLTDDGSGSEQVLRATNTINDGMGMLTAFTLHATALAFGDAETAREFMDKIDQA